MNQDFLHNQNKAGFMRRLMAAVYDWLLVIALTVILSIPVVALTDDVIQPDSYQFATLLVAGIFFVGFWINGGQTVGMKAWRIELIQLNGMPVPARLALLRFVGACISALPAGLGFLWLLWDRDRLSWHDRWSGTTIKLLPKVKKSANSS